MLLFARGVETRAPEPAAARFKEYYEGTWHLEPDMSQFRGLPGKAPQDNPFLTSQTLVHDANGWYVASILHSMHRRTPMNNQDERRRRYLMNRRAFVGMAAAGAASPLLARAAAAQPAPRARNVVLVHGLFADGSCWSEVIARLQPKGINVTAVQNPLTSLKDAVEATQRVLATQDGPIVLVAHSFGGMIVTEAGVDPKVSALVYIAARAPDAGEDYTALAKQFPTPPASAGIVWSGDEGRLGEEAFLRDFAGDLPADKARVLYAVQAPFKRALLADKTTHAAWRSKPSWYVVSADDRTINPDIERFMAKRMGAKTTEIKASHLSLISQPDMITNVILEAVGQT
jgi:pimeloyl-ACP methyl ester carboxylesterase